MSGGSDAEQRLGLIEYLRSVGFTDEQIAVNDRRLLSLAARRVLFGDEERVTVAEIAARAGCDESLVRKVRLASGLPDGGDDAVCSPREVDVMASFIMGAALLGEDVALQFTRVLGTATAGLAEAALATFASNRQASLREDGAELAEIARAGAEATVALLAVPPVLDVLLRLHFEYVITGRFASDDTSPTVDVAIGFVDLVESTQLTLSLSSAEMSGALSDFERSASDAVVGVGGRVVKRIGDAVIFVTSDAAGACRAAATILELVAGHPMLNTARAAVTWGRVLPRDGDYFGSAVKLAARAVALAEPGMIVVDAEVRDALDRGVWPVAPLGDQALKGFDDPVALFALREAHSDAPVPGVDAAPGGAR
jgi:class 3 adenylate cyclase